MSDWKTRPLGEIARIEIGGTPSRNEPSYWATEHDEGFPWVAISDIGPRIITSTAERITKYGVNSSNTKPVPSGTVMMSFKLTIGRTSIAGAELFTNEAIAAFYPDTGEVDPVFLFYMLPVAAGSAVTDTAIKGATLNKDKLRRLLFRYPLRPQQRKIARILTTLDNLIEKTEALIAKYQAIKQGMMHDLFTRGVDAHGHLRPPQAEAPDLYKQSELGWIPKEWDVARLGEEIGPIVSGWSPNCDAVPADQGQWAILKTTAVVWDGYEETENKRLPDGLEPIPDLEVQMDDILITRKGPMDRVGVVVHVPGTRPRLMIPDTVFRLRLLPGRQLLPAFVPLSLGSEIVQRDWFGKKIGLAEAQVDINHRILKGTLFPRPNEDEQLEIVKRNCSASSHLASMREELRKYQRLKSGLMQDLLTGKVRVKVNDGEEVAV